MLGVCGGLQMLGLSLDDPQGHDGQVIQDLPGLGLLPLHTQFGPGKQLLDSAVSFGAPQGAWAPLAGVVARAYQIRCGQTTALGGLGVLQDARGQTIGWQRGPVLGVYAHGLFESPAVLQALFGATVPTLQDAFETLADLAESSLDRDLLARWLGRPAA